MTSNISLNLAEFLVLFFIFVAVITDIRTRKIFNKLTFPGMFLGILFNMFYQFYPHIFNGLVFSIKGLFLGIVIFFVPFMLGGLGAGDLKLLGVVGAFMGIEFVLWTGLYGALAGGLISLVIMVSNKEKLKQTLLSIKNLFMALLLRAQLPRTTQDAGNAFPYSLAILVGFLYAALFKF